MTSNLEFGLPKELGDGLILRWAVPDDAQAIAEFNFQLHNDNPNGRPELWLKDWTRDLMSGRHPTTLANDFTVVVDENKTGKIVSSGVLISQIWSIGGIAFGCGRPELIATDPDYRRQGLVRAQMEAMHQKSKARGELVQAITGIPWYYRKFGYEMALNLGGSRHLGLDKLKPIPQDQQPTYRLRPANLADLPILKTLYDIQCASSLVSCCREDAVWRYEIANSQPERISQRTLRVIETMNGEVVGYAALIIFPRADTVNEIAVIPDHSLRSAGLFLARALKDALQKDSKSGANQVIGIFFNLGASHPVYEALAEELDRPRSPYAWYLRVNDLQAFLAHIRPLLEKRLAGSVMAGHDGVLRLNFYEYQLALRFQEGRLLEIDTYKAKHFFDGDAYFPDLTFMQLLFGYRSLDELKYARADCFTENAEATVLLNALFPKQHSDVIPLA